MFAQKCQIRHCFKWVPIYDDGINKLIENVTRQPVRVWHGKVCGLPNRQRMLWTICSCQWSLRLLALRFRRIKINDKKKNGFPLLFPWVVHTLIVRQTFSINYNTIKLQLSIFAVPPHAMCVVWFIKNSRNIVYFFDWGWDIQFFAHVIVQCT